MISDYREGDTIQLLLRGEHAASVIERWWEHSYRVDVRLRKAKTSGCMVIETTDVMFASHITQWYGEVKVNIKHEGGQ